MVYTMSLTTLSFLPLSSTHTHAFNVHSSNIKNMVVKQWHVVEISKRQPTRLISNKHLLAFLLNSWVLGIKGFWYTSDIEKGERPKNGKPKKIIKNKRKQKDEGEHQIQ